MCDLLYWPAFLDVLVGFALFLDILDKAQIYFCQVNPRYLFLVICYHLIKTECRICENIRSFELFFLDKQEFIELLLPLSSRSSVTKSLQSLWAGNGIVPKKIDTGNWSQAQLCFSTTIFANHLVNIEKVVWPFTHLFPYLIY